jgi:putative transcriptional regulator
MIFRHRVKEFRTNHQWSQEALGAKVGVSRQTIISIESYRYNPSLELGMKLAHAFGVPIDTLFYFVFQSFDQEQD